MSPPRSSLIAAPGWFGARRRLSRRISGADPALRGRHGDDGLGRRPADALCRARAAEPRRLCARQLQRRDTRSAEAGLKYFVLGALASGILLYGISLLYGFTGTTLFGGIAARARARRASRPASCSASSSCSPASPSRSARCRSTCGRPTSTKARRRRSPPSSPRAPKVAAMALLARVAIEAMGPATDRMAPDRHLHGARLDHPRRRRRDRPDQHQAAARLLARSTMSASR